VSTLFPLPPPNAIPPVSDVSACQSRLPPAPVATEELPARTESPIQLCLDLGIRNQGHASREDSAPANPPDSAATSRAVSSFLSDQESGIYPLEWEDLSAFHTWRREEELAHSIELIASSSVSGGRSYLQKRVYVCTRQLSGSPNKFKKKFPHRFQKIGTKKTGCRCQIVIKRFHHTPAVLGRYVNEHDHDLSSGNIAYMCLSRTAQETIKAMLIQQIDRRAIVRNLNIIYIPIT